MYRRIEEMYEPITQENSQHWGLYRVHCKSKKSSCQLLLCWPANPLRVPFAVHLLPEGMAVLMINYVPCFPPACLCLLFSAVPWPLSAQPAIQCLDNYLMLAGLILPGLARAPWEEGIWGKPLHCIAAAAKQLHGASQEGLHLLQTLKQLHNLLICLFQGCKVTLSKEQHPESFSVLCPSPNLLFLHVLININLLRAEGGHMHSKSTWPTVIVFLLPLIISSISLCSW